MICTYSICSVSNWAEKKSGGKKRHKNPVRKNSSSVWQVTVWNQHTFVKKMLNYHDILSYYDVDIGYNGCWLKTLWQ